MMVPDSRLAHEPVFNLPRVVLLVVLLLVGVHGVRLWLLPDLFDFRVLLEGAVVPARWTAAYGRVEPGEIISAAEGPLQQELARYVLAEGGGKPWTAFTYALLHGSWAHVLMNSIWLAAFGSPVARRCRPFRFLLLAAASALGGAVAHTLVHPFQALPMIGASASVSGMMAAAAWFVFGPPVGHEEQRTAQPHARPRETLTGLVTNRRVLAFLLAWLVTNYLSAILAQPLGIADASIAWEAHVGGFVTGLLLFPLADPLNPRRKPA
jgi:membrane associated rhomboid family serine protease